MPTYEYKCKSCQEKFEELQKITDPAIDKCPHCGGPVERIISGGAGMVFKGSGFYITDNRSDKYKKAANNDKFPTTVSTSDSTKDKKNSDTKPTKKD